LNNQECAKPVVASDISNKGMNCKQVQGHKFAIEKHAI